MSILDQITAHKRTEIDRLYRKSQPNLFRELFENRHSESTILIAEIKPKSPSAGQITDRDPYEVAQVYLDYGVDALSVLTDYEFFGGSLELLELLREKTKLPTLRKDFILDPIQIYQSALLPVEAVLLIVKILTKKQLSDYIGLCWQLSLVPVVEINQADELQVALDAGAEFIGVNSRDLTTFDVNLDQQLDLIRQIPEDKYAVAFSGISEREQVQAAREAGACGVLVGTSLLQATDIGAKVTELKKA
jgi:indole-3-glycerol phosphate synthase